MPPKKKLKPLQGQTQLSFSKRPEASKHQEQEAATAIEMMRKRMKTMKNQHKQNLRNLRNEDFLSHGSKHICGWSMRNMETICIGKSARRLGNRMDE